MKYVKDSNSSQRKFRNQFSAFSPPHFSSLSWQHENIINLSKSSDKTFPSIFKNIASMKNQVSELEKSFLERKLNIKSPKKKKEKSCGSWEWRKIIISSFQSSLFVAGVFAFENVFRWYYSHPAVFDEEAAIYLSHTHFISSCRRLVVCRRSFNDSRESLRRWYLACLEYIWSEFMTFDYEMSARVRHFWVLARCQTLSRVVFSSLCKSRVMKIELCLWIIFNVVWGENNKSATGNQRSWVHIKILSSTILRLWQTARQYGEKKSKYWKFIALWSRRYDVSLKRHINASWTSSRHSTFQLTFY